MMVHKIRFLYPLLIAMAIAALTGGAPAQTGIISGTISTPSSLPAPPHRTFPVFAPVVYLVPDAAAAPRPAAAPAVIKLQWLRFQPSVLAVQAGDPVEFENLDSVPHHVALLSFWGASLFQARCAVCHGSSGRGDTELGRSLYPPAVNLTSSTIQGWSEQHLYSVLHAGVHGSGMPTWGGVLTNPQLRVLARYIHMLPALDQGKVNLPSGNRAARMAAGWIDVGLGPIAPAARQSMRFPQPGVYPLIDEVDDTMAGFIVVTPSPWYAVAARNGTYQIAGVPAGRYHITAWAPGQGMRTREVTVRAAGTVVDFSFPEK